MEPNKLTNQSLNEMDLYYLLLHEYFGLSVLCSALLFCSVHVHVDVDALVIAVIIARYGVYSI